MALPPPRDGAVALITGASSGIGAALARGLDERGYDTILVARRRDRLEALAADLQRKHARHAHVMPCDLADAEARGRLLAEIARLGLEVDVLALSAGFGLAGPFISHPPERITTMLRTNVEAVIELSRVLIPPMTARRAGAVLFVSSMAGNQPMPNFGAYAASKAAVTSLSEALHAELKQSGVSVTALCPGGVQTEFSEVAGASAAERRTPAALMISAEECAHAGLAGLEQGRRVVVPRRAVRTFSWFGAHAPRAVWLPLCRKLFA